MDPEHCAARMTATGWQTRWIPLTRMLGGLYFPWYGTNTVTRLNTLAAAAV